MEIRPVQRISGMGISLRNVTPDDADFIFGLRTNTDLNRHISAVEGDVGRQVEYLQRYRAGTGAAYFIIESEYHVPLGTVRLYDQRVDSFCWGSWIVKPNAPPRTGTRSALLVYYFGFDYLGFNSSHFDVRQANVNVWQFHEKCGAVLTKETETDRFYIFPRSSWLQTKSRYAELLDQTPQVSIIE